MTGKKKVSLVSLNGVLSESFMYTSIISVLTLRFYFRVHMKTIKQQNNININLYNLLK